MISFFHLDIGFSHLWHVSVKASAFLTKCHLVVHVISSFFEPGISGHCFTSQFSQFKWLDFLYITDFLVVAILHLYVIGFCFDAVLCNSFYFFFFLVLPHWDFSMSRIHSALLVTSTLGSSWKASWPMFLRFRLMSEFRPWKFWILFQSPSSSSSGSSTMSVQWILGWKGWPIVFSSSKEAMNSGGSNIPSTMHGKLQAGTCTAHALLFMLYFRINVLLSLHRPLSLN